MIPKRYKLIIVGLLAVILIMAFFTCNKPKPTPPAPVPGQTTKEIVQVVKIDSARLKKVTDSLTAEKSALKKELAVAEKDLKDISGIADQLSDDLERALDTTAGAEIQRQFAEYREVQEKKDSAFLTVYEAQNGIISNLEEQNRVKDSAQAVFKAQFRQVVANSDYDNRVIIPGLKKEVKQQRRGKVFWKGVAIAGGLIITYKSIK